MAIIETATGKWEVVIGLEIHAQVKSNSKLFSGASTQFGGEPNNNVSLIDAGMPGMLPVVNQQCIKQAIKTGLGLEADINKSSAFDRKNYFYPDLPQGYQISQFYYPIVQDGKIEISQEDGSKKEIGIERIHLEQDAGKSLHDQSPDYSFIDLNRCGIALMEIVSKPDIRSSYEAAEYTKKIRTILRYLDTSDGDMEKGNFRVDANVSVRRPGESFGTRCEIKNLNSMRFIMKAIDYEVSRQIALIENGDKVIQETRLFNSDTGVTKTMRSKEDANDYRYFPDPDLLPVTVDQELLDSVSNDMPELPDEKVRRYVNELGLKQYDAEVITAEKEVASYFEQVAEQVDPKLAANWITAELFGMLNKADIDITDCKVTPELLAELINLIQEEVISGKIAKSVFEEVFDQGASPRKIVKQKGLEQITDKSKIEAIVEEILSANPDNVDKYKAGKTKVFGFFVGQVMKQTNGKANPQIVNDIIQAKLEKF